MKFEYGIVTLENGKPWAVEGADTSSFVFDGTLVLTLTKLGSEGWELTAAIPDWNNSLRQLLIFKRQKAPTSPTSTSSPSAPPQLS